MRQKYIDERWPTLMVFGKHADTDQPCVSDSNDALNVFVADAVQAAALVDHYARLHEEFSELIQAFDQAAPEAFTAFWYNR